MNLTKKFPRILRQTKNLYRKKVKKEEDSSTDAMMVKETLQEDSHPSLSSPRSHANGSGMMKRTQTRPVNAILKLSFDTTEWKILKEDCNCTGIEAMPLEVPPPTAVKSEAMEDMAKKEESGDTTVAPEPMEQLPPIEVIEILENLCGGIQPLKAARPSGLRMWRLRHGGTQHPWRPPKGTSCSSSWFFWST